MMRAGNYAARPPVGAINIRDRQWIYQRRVAGWSWRRIAARFTPPADAAAVASFAASWVAFLKTPLDPRRPPHPRRMT